MEYNSGRPNLILPEYGRNIQKMVEFALSVEDREKRTNIAKTIVSIMAQLNPQVRESADYKQKLWDQLYIISDFALDVDAPYAKPEPEVLLAKPAQISYSTHDLKFGHYGKNIQNIIEKVAEMEESPEKEAMVNSIANHLKKAFLTWNRDSVADEVIYDHLNKLSSGKLKLSEDAKLQHTSELIGKPIQKKKKFFPRQKDNNKMRRKK